MSRKDIISCSREYSSEWMVNWSCCVLYWWSTGHAVYCIDGQLVLMCTLLMVNWPWYVLYWWSTGPAVYSIYGQLVLLCTLLMVYWSCCVLYCWSPGPYVYSIYGQLVLLCTILKVKLSYCVRCWWGFCLFGGNPLLPFQKCPPISFDKMPLFKMPFLKGHFDKSILSRNIEEHFWKSKRAFHICSLEMPSYTTWQNALIHNALFKKGIFYKSIL